MTVRPEVSLQDAIEFVAVSGADTSQIALMSIAVSLKRIADTLDGTAAGICVTETLLGGARVHD